MLLGDVTARGYVSLLVHRYDVGVRVGYVAAGKQESNSGHSIEPLEHLCHALADEDDSHCHIGRKIIEKRVMLSGYDLDVAGTELACSTRRSGACSAVPRRARKVRCCATLAR